MPNLEYQQKETQNMTHKRAMVPKRGTERKKTQGQEKKIRGDSTPHQSNQLGDEVINRRSVIGSRLVQDVTPMAITV